MEKKILLIILVLVMFSVCSVGQIKVDAGEEAGVKINEVNFPDSRFRSYISSYDKDKNGYLSQEENQNITEVYFDGGDNVSYQKLNSLKGIEFLSNLITIYLFDTEVTSIDLGRNSNLTKVEILNTNLQEFKLPKDNRIAELKLGYCELSQVDFSILPELKTVSLYSCKSMKKVDLSQNHKLVRIELSDKTISYPFKRATSGPKTVIVGNNEKLEVIRCDLSSLQNLKIGNTPVLKWFSIEQSKKIKSLNTKKMPKLETLSVKNCGLTTLNLAKNKKLQSLNVSKNKLKILNITKNKILKKLYCDNNKLAKLNLKNNVKLITLQCSSNKLKTLNLSTNKKLKNLSCKKNKIDKLNIRKTKLKTKKITCDKKVKIVK